MEWRRDVKPHQFKGKSGVFALAFFVDATQLAIHDLAICVEHELIGGIVVFVRIDRAACYFNRGRILLLNLIPDCLETFFVAGVGAIIAPALMGTSRLVLKEIHVLARLFEPGNYLAFPFDDVAKKDMEVGDIERAVPPAHCTIGHVFENLLPGLDLLLQRLFARTVDDERCFGRGGLVADVSQMLLDVRRVEKLENVRTYGVDGGAGRCAVWLQAVVYDRSIRPLFATAGVIVQLFREFEHKGTIIGRVAGITFGGVERRGCEVVEEAVREIPHAEGAFFDSVDFARIGAPNLVFE